MQPSTSSTYSSSLLKLEKALDIAPKESMKQLLAIDTTSLEGVDRLSLKEKQEVYHKMSLLKKEENDFRAACEYAEKSIACRDSLEADNKTEYISNMNAFQEHERQQQRIARMNRELSEQELSYYRLPVLLLLFLGAFIVFRIKQAKKKVEVSLKEKELDMVQLQNSLRETEIKYLKEKHDREAIEIELLNQSVEYYKRLNAACEGRFAFFSRCACPCGGRRIFSPFPPGRRTQLYIYKKT